MFDASQASRYGLYLARLREEELHRSWQEANRRARRKDGRQISRARALRLAIGTAIARAGEALASLGRAVSGARAA